MSKRPVTRIALACKAAGLMQKQLADMIYMDADLLREKSSGQMLARSKARGRKRFTEEEIARISDCMGVSPVWISGKGNLSPIPSVLGRAVFDPETTTQVARALISYFSIPLHRMVAAAIHENRLLSLQAEILGAAERLKGYLSPKSQKGTPGRLRDSLNYSIAQKWHNDALKTLDDSPIQEEAAIRVHLILEGLRNRFRNSSKVLLRAYRSGLVSSQESQANPCPKPRKRRSMSTWRYFQLVAEYEEKILEGGMLCRASRTANPHKVRNELDSHQSKRLHKLHLLYGDKFRTGDQEPSKRVVRDVSDRKIRINSASKEGARKKSPLRRKISKKKKVMARDSKPTAPRSLSRIKNGGRKGAKVLENRQRVTGLGTKNLL